MCRLAALVLLVNVSGLAPAFASFAGYPSIDLCGDDCDTGPLNKCPPACISCPTGLAARAVPPATSPVTPPLYLELPASHAVSRLLGPPQRVDADGVFHPPRARASSYTQRK